MINIVNNNLGGGDWEGLYLQGKIFRQGHSLTTDDFIELLEHLGYGVETDRIDDESMEKLGYNFPESYEEFNKIVYEEL